VKRRIETGLDRTVAVERGKEMGVRDGAASVMVPVPMDGGGGGGGGGRNCRQDGG